MTIEEYSTRMGYEQTCDMAEYTIANTAYMMAGNMDKDTFCKEWKKHGQSPLVQLLSQAANSRDVAYRDALTKERQVAHSILRESGHVRGGFNDNDESAEILDGIAAKLIGKPDCIKWKLEKGFDLGDADIAYIKDNLR